MLKQTRATLADVQALTRQRWPAGRAEATHLIRAQFDGRPQLQDSLLISEDGDSVSAVGWFVSYDSAEELLEEHDAFCAAVTDVVGEPFDLTATTAAWRSKGFLIESYAHPATRGDPKSSHQIGISPGGI